MTMWFINRARRRKGRKIYMQTE